MEQLSRAAACVRQAVPEPPLVLVLGVLVICLGAARLWSRLRRSSTSPLPPQPPGIPILGHLPELVRENRARTWHLKLSEWAREYGTILGVRTGYVVDYYVNSDKMVKEIFDKRSAQTADRPVWIMSSTILNNDYNTLFLDASNPRWKNQRKVIQQLLTSVQQADKIIPLIEYETLKFLHDNVCDPKGGLSGARLYREIGRYTYSAFATAIIGMDVPSADDAVIEFLKETEIQILYTFPWSNIIDLIPGLGRLPLCLKPWERQGRARYRRDLAWSMKRLKTVQERMEDGDSSLRETFLGAVLSDENLRGMSGREEVAVLSLALIVASADTSRMTTWAFLEAMMMFPDVQAKAQEEIGKSPSHRAVGDRVPVYDDFTRIPYIRMMMKEVWRWRPPVALGHPHITSRDMQVGQYHLPKGSRLHINAYAISRDPERHVNPDRFWPERYKEDGTTTMESINSQDATKRDHFAFGAGRRVCPGYHVAERSFIVTMMRILWAFDVVPAPGTKEPLEFADYAGALPGNPAEDMPVKLRCRSEARKAVVVKTYERETAVRPEMIPLNLGEGTIPEPSAYM